MYIKRHIYLLDFLCTAVACQTTRIDLPVRCGEIMVSLSGEPVVDASTKTDPAVAPADCKVRIVDVNGTMQPVEFQYTAPVSKIVPFGTYYVEAENCSEAEAENGNGRKRVAGKSGNVTLDEVNLIKSASASCEVTNARVAVRFDASTSGRFPEGLTVTLKNASGRTVTVSYTAASVETATWFNPTAELEYTIAGRYDYAGITRDILNTAVVKLPGGRTAIEAKDNVLIEVKVDSQSGQLKPDVKFDTSMTETDHPSGFNPYS